MASAKEVSFDGSLMPIDQFARDVYGYNYSTDPLSQLGSLFMGDSNGRIKREYETYKANWSNYQNAKAIEEQRAYDAMREDTAYQRMVKDLKAAGLNPWLAVQSSLGGVSTNPSSSKKYEAPKETAKNSNVGRNIALMLLASAKLVAALV